MWLIEPHSPARMSRQSAAQDKGNKNVNNVQVLFDLYPKTRCFVSGVVLY